MMTSELTFPAISHCQGIYKVRGSLYWQ